MKSIKYRATRLISSDEVSSANRDTPEAALLIAIIERALLDRCYLEDKRLPPFTWSPPTEPVFTAEWRLLDGFFFGATSRVGVDGFNLAGICDLVFTNPIAVCERIRRIVMRGALRHPEISSRYQTFKERELRNVRNR